jgi:UDP-2-acetamido-3-amino-2,3-dideoxy-glucuronate N-acetyltransferase
MHSQVAAVADYITHDTARIEQPCAIGAGTRIGPFCHVMEGARIGRDCVLGHNVVVESAAIIGDGVTIGDNVSVCDGVVLQDNVFCGPSVVFATLLHPRAEFPRPEDRRPIVVRRGATLGGHATVLPGLRVCDYAVVAAGAVVTHDVPLYAVVAGVPARQLGWLCRCGQGRLNFQGVADAQCHVCRRQYHRGGNGIWELPRANAN